MADLPASWAAAPFWMREFAMMTDEDIAAACDADRPQRRGEILLARIPVRS